MSQIWAFVTDQMCRHRISDEKGSAADRAYNIIILPGEVLHNNDYQSCGNYSNDGEDGGQRGQGNPNHLRMIMTAMMMVLMIVVMMMVVVVVGVVTVVMMMLVMMVNGKATKVTCSTKSVLQQPIVTPASAIELTILRAHLFY